MFLPFESGQAFVSVLFNSVQWKWSYVTSATGSKKVMHFPAWLQGILDIRVLFPSVRNLITQKALCSGETHKTCGEAVHELFNTLRWVLLWNHPISGRHTIKEPTDNSSPCHLNLSIWAPMYGGTESRYPCCASSWS